MTAAPTGVGPYRGGCTGKVAFACYAVASAAANRRAKRTTGNKPRIPREPYRCGCGAWHIGKVKP